MTDFRDKLELDVEIAYDFDDGITLDSVWIGRGDRAIEITHLLSKQEWEHAYMACVDHYLGECDRLEAMAEDAAESRAEDLRMQRMEE